MCRAKVALYSTVSGIHGRSMAEHGMHYHGRFIMARCSDVQVMLNLFIAIVTFSFQRVQQQAQGEAHEDWSSPLA